MARRSFSRLPARRQGPRRMSQWVASADSTASQTLAAATAVIDSSFTAASLAAQFVPSTVVRVRGTLWVASDQASASEEPFGALGFSVVEEAARAAGVASVLTPINDETSDGFWVWLPFQAYFATGQGVTWQRYDFDSKAMRKIENDDAIIVTLENAHATFGLEYILKFRMLFKLH